MPVTRAQHNSSTVGRRGFRASESRRNYPVSSSVRFVYERTEQKVTAAAAGYDTARTTRDCAAEIIVVGVVFRVAHDRVGAAAVGRAISSLAPSSPLSLAVGPFIIPSVSRRRPPPGTMTTTTTYPFTLPFAGLLSRYRSLSNVTPSDAVCRRDADDEFRLDAAILGFFFFVFFVRVTRRAFAAKRKTLAQHRI